MRTFLFSLDLLDLFKIFYYSYFKFLTVARVRSDQEPKRVQVKGKVKRACGHGGKSEISQVNHSAEFIAKTIGEL